MHTQAYKNEAQFRYNIFSVQSSHPLILHSSSIYSPSMGSEGLNWSILGIWKAKDQVIHYLMGKDPNIFIYFYHNSHVRG